jgi:nucleotide-binding universal stress UspA family protein
MATATLLEKRSFSSSQLTSQEPKTAGPLLLATDGTARSDAAIRAARAISSATGQPVLVLAVHAPLPVMGPEVQLATSASMDTESRAGLLGQVKDQLEREGVARWPIKVTTGFPAGTIAKLAHRIDASLIILGLGGHGVLDRLFGDEMALQVLRVGLAPILAVADDFQGMPSRALCAVDFSASSKRALELAAPLIADGGRVTLAHVIASDTDPLKLSAMNRVHVGSVAGALKRLAGDVNLPAGIATEHRVLAGDPAKELLALAAELHPQLIVTGSHGHNFLSRLLVGSVSTQLLRKAGCSILVVPPLDAPGFLEELPDQPGRFAFYEWAERLEEFTRQNLWRSARLEVIDPEMGAQVAADHVRFMGAAFDALDGHVHVMFESPDGAGKHFTHGIEGVTGIQILRGRSGDAYLRIGHGGGQTLLTLVR